MGKKKASKGDAVHIVVSGVTAIRLLESARANRRSASAQAHILLDEAMDAIGVKVPGEDVSPSARSRR